MADKLADLIRELEAVIKYESMPARLGLQFDDYNVVPVGSIRQIIRRYKEEAAHSEK